MPENKNIFMQEFRSRPIAYGVQVVGIVIILLNVWLSTKLFPLASNIDKIVVRINAMEIDVTKLQEDAKVDSDMVVKMEGIRVTLEAVQSRLERLDTRLSKHLGI